MFLAIDCLHVSLLGPRHRRQSVDGLDQCTTADLCGCRDVGGPGKQVGGAEGPLDVLGPDAGQAGGAGRAVR